MITFGYQIFLLFFWFHSPSLFVHTNQPFVWFCLLTLFFLPAKISIISTGFPARNRNSTELLLLLLRLQLNLIVVFLSNSRAERYTKMIWAPSFLTIQTL